MQTIYTIAIWILGSISWVFQLFSERHRLWWKGRKRQQIEAHRGAQPVWVHCASLGEFEQGRPLIETIKKQWPEIPIVLSFFSPSGYEVRSNYDKVDAVYYLPIDLPGPVSKFIDKVRPRVAIFVKYEFWFNYLKYLRIKEVPTVFISVLIHSKHLMLRPLGHSLAEHVRNVNQIFVQNEASKAALERHDFENVTVVGDTRVDRVLQIRKNQKSFGWLDDLAERRKTIVYGSIWPSDLKHLHPFVNANLDGEHLHVVAPHRLDQSLISELLTWGKGRAGRLSELATLDRDLRVLVVDTIGDLAHIYKWAWLSYVGGGFDQGIHSILEPAAFFRPISFGPKHQHFQEARTLLEQEIAFEINDKRSLASVVDYFKDHGNYQLAADRCAEYFHAHQGATTKIVHYLHQQNWLTQSI